MDIDNEILKQEKEKEFLIDKLLDGKLKGWEIYWAVITMVLLAVLTWFQMRVGIWGAFEAQLQRPVGVILFIVFLYLYTPFKEKNISTIRLITFHVIPALLALVVLFYYVSNYQELIFRFGIAKPQDIFYGIVLIILVLDATRRVVGWAMPIIATLCLLYSFFGNYIPGMFYHPGFSLSRVIGLHLLTTDGLFSIPAGVVTTFLVLFVIFGAALEVTGAGKSMLELAYSLVGRWTAGPPKAAIVASSLFGSISGSAVANVVSTGSVTIPLMKRYGYGGKFAGAVEAVASTGGQFMPPIMGTSAFILAEVVGIPYLQVALAALIPALLYYISVFIQVDFRAREKGLSPMKKEEIPSVLMVLKESWHLYIPILVLVYLLLKGYSMQRIGFVLVVSTMVVTFIKKETRLTIRKFIKIFEAGFSTALSVVMVCVTAGLVIGSLTMTGVGIRISTIVMSLAQQNILFALILTAMVATIMGMGMPTVAVYVVVASILGGALGNLGLNLLAVHLFILYYGVIANITPPVAVSAYAAASISGDDPWSTGIDACKLGFAAYFIPFMFVYDPALIGYGSWQNIFYVTFTSLLGVIALGACMEGYFLGKTKLWERIILFCSAICLIVPEVYSDFVGLGLFGLIIIIQYKIPQRFSRILAK